MPNDPWDRGEEEGLRSSSFFEIPGAYEMKKKLLDKMRASGVPGAGIAADGADLLIPETANPAQLVGKAGKLGSKMMMMKDKLPKIEKAEEAALDYSKINKINPQTEARTIDYAQLKKKVPESGVTLDYSSGTANAAKDLDVIAARRAEALKRMQDTAKNKSSTYVK